MSDETTQLPIVAPERTAITATSEAETLAAYLATVDEHAERIRKLAASHDTEGFRERVRGAIADLQQFDAYLAEADRAARDAETSAAFDDWATGGERR